MKTLSALLLVALGLCILPVLNAADKTATPVNAPKPAPKATAKSDPKATKADPKTAPATATKTDPKAPTATAAKDAKAKPEETKPVVGALLERSNGGFLNLKVDGGWTITFLDKDKKEVKADLFRAIIRYRRHLKNSQFILTLSADGKSLHSSLPVDRPYLFASLPVLLFKEGVEDSTESYRVAFKQPMAGDGEGVPIDEMSPEDLKKIPAPK